MEDTALTELLTAILEDGIKVSIDKTKDKFRFTFKKKGWEGYLTVPVSKLDDLWGKEFDDFVMFRLRERIHKFLRFIEDEEE